MSLTYFTTVQLSISAHVCTQHMSVAPCSLPSSSSSDGGAELAGADEVGLPLLLLLHRRQR
jgi:hypothetical protein